MGAWEDRGRGAEPHVRLTGRIFPHPPMIDLTPEDVAEFRTLFREETGREIADEDARAYAENLIRLVSFVMREELPPFV